MKKIFALLLMMTTLLFCVGCNQSSNTDNDHNHDHTHDYTEPDSNYQNNQDTQNIPASAMEGFVQGSVYANTFLNLNFTAPESWVFFDKEALAGRTGADPELSAKESADKNGSAFAMLAVNAPKDASVSIVYENLLVTVGSPLTGEEYVDAVILAGLNQTTQSVLDSVTSVEIGGNTYTKVVIVTVDPNSTMIQTHYLRGIGDYMVHITASIPEGNESEVDFDSMFS